jgi:Tol biopolymer transport system component
MKVRAGLLLVALVAAGSAAWCLLAGREADPPPEITVVRESELGTPLAASSGFALSPDGSTLAFITTVEGRAMLALWAPGPPAQSGPEAHAHVIPGTEDARHPSWSADGGWIAFATEDGEPLKKVDVRTHKVFVVSATGTGGSAWNASGDLLYTGPDAALHRVDPGGRSVRVTTIDPSSNEAEHAWPAFLPDGRRFIYLSRGARPSDSRLYLSSLDAPHERRVVAEAHSAPRYAAGHLFFIYEGILMAQPFDAQAGRVTGVALPLAVGLHEDPWSGEGAFAASDSGLLAFRLARTPPDQLAWFTIGSMTAETVAGFTDVHEARASRDGSRIAATLRDAATGMDDIWIAGADGTSPRRLTSHPSSDNSPVWYADGASLAFRSNRTGVYNLHTVDLETGRERRLLESSVDDQPTDVSPGGDLLLFNRWSMDTRQDVWALPIAGGTPFAVLATEFVEGHATFSPDGAWIAYESNESGANQVYVRRYPIDGPGARISPNGGHKPRWTSGGRTIVYVRDDNRFEAVDLAVEGGTFTASKPRELFITRPGIDEVGGFDIDPGGRRILAPAPGSRGTPEPSITFIRNWQRLLAPGS